jgi:hypothetical protein
VRISVSIAMRSMKKVSGVRSQVSGFRPEARSQQLVAELIHITARDTMAFLRGRSVWLVLILCRGKF